MISPINHDFQWGRSEVVIIYPDIISIHQASLLAAASPAASPAPGPAGAGGAELASDLGHGRRNAEVIYKGLNKWETNSSNFSNYIWCYSSRGYIYYMFFFSNFIGVYKRKPRCKWKGSSGSCCFVFRNSLGLSCFCSDLFIFLWKVWFF